MPPEPHNGDGNGGAHGGEETSDEFGRQIESHRALLRKNALRLSGRPDVADDLVQGTLLRALQRRARFVPGTRLDTWLVRILTNQFLDYLRHEKVKRGAEPELAVLATTDWEMDDWGLGGISDAALYEAINALEPDLRDLVTLCYIQRKRYCDAAKQLNLASGTVATRLMRARLRLRERLTTTSMDAVK